MPESLFSSAPFMPHGHCYLWKPGLVAMEVLSNGAIGLSYMAISATLAYMVSRMRDLPFKMVYVAFGVFIVTCGVTHLVDVVTVWWPIYWFDGWVRVVTGIASVGTAAMLPPLVPQAVALARGASAMRDRGVRLETALRDLTRVYEKTRELEQLKTQFFANVSHELRTPLSLVLGPVERLLASTDLTESQRRDLELVGRNARLLLRHVNDLLDAAKLEAGRLAPVYSRRDVADEVRVVASYFEELAAHRGVRLAVVAPPSLPAQLDHELIRRVVLNLLSNAFKFVPDGGVVRCEVTPHDDGRFRIEVADSGPGVAPEHRHAIFERFRQIEQGGDRPHAGTGLGLAIARDIVELHGGSIDVEAAREGGASFVVELPVEVPEGRAIAAETARDDDRSTEAAARQAVGELERPARPEPARPAPGRPHVLIAEDNADMNRFVCELLSDEYETTCVFDGEAALAHLDREPPDMVVTDLMMPGLAGDRLLAAIRARAEFDDVPVIVLSARADDELRLSLLRSGAQDYLTKPFTAEELRLRVRNVLSAARARVTLRRELESQARDLATLASEAVQRQRQLESALASVRIAREQAVRASEVKTNFLRMVSHELRTPLSTIQLQLELFARDTSRTPREKTVLARVQRAAARLSRLVESVLHYARIESGHMETRVRAFDLAALARDVLDEVRPEADRQGLALRLETDGVPPLRSDPDLVRIVLLNLVANAIKFTPEGSVEIALGRAGDEHELRVTDTGPGIPAGEQERIFEPFEQLEAVENKSRPGVGLGLALVREMVAALDGRIALDSGDGRGCTFTIWLPSLPAAEEAAS